MSTFNSKEAAERLIRSFRCINCEKQKDNCKCSRGTRIRILIKELEKAYEVGYENGLSKGVSLSEEYKES